mgnify:CR=1 FL=1|tara:strand:+ start:189 stop:377 length:189 start_codon:yes stop_codon:yes gene_type:complete
MKKEHTKSTDLPVLNKEDRASCLAIIRLLVRLHAWSHLKAGTCVESAKGFMRCLAEREAHRG